MRRNSGCPYEQNIAFKSHCTWTNSMEGRFYYYNDMLKIQGSSGSPWLMLTTDLIALTVFFVLIVF